MLHLDEAWCRENVDFRGDFSVIRDGELFDRYLEVVANLPEMRAAAASAQLQRLLTAAIDASCQVAPVLRDRQLAERIKHALLASIESPATLDELARSFGCRKETLIRVFRRAFHITPRAFVNNARIERAKRQLKMGDEIAHVAADLGFSDQAQLHRAFVSYTASTPGQYQRARPRAGINFRQ